LGQKRATFGGFAQDDRVFSLVESRGGSRLRETHFAEETVGFVDGGHPVGGELAFVVVATG
jgi:hypothetical protein